MAAVCGETVFSLYQKKKKIDFHKLHSILSSNKKLIDWYTLQIHRRQKKTYRSP